MFHNLHKKLLAASAAFAIAASSQLSAVLLPVAGVVELFPPVDVTVGGPSFSATDMFYINEGSHAIALLPVDAKPVGGPGTIGWIGAVVNSDYIFSQEYAPGLTVFTKTLVFANKILGWQRLGATLSVTDPVVGLPGVIYPTGNLLGRQLEANDVTMLDPGDPTGKTLKVTFYNYNQMDNIRVFTATPEPTTYMIMGGALGLVMLLAYRRRKSLA